MIQRLQINCSNRVFAVNKLPYADNCIRAASPFGTERRRGTMAGLTPAKKRTLHFTGASYLRQRLVLSLLSGRPVRISEIRSNDVAPGLCAAEVSFVRLLDKLTTGSAIHINDTGTVLVLKPGQLTPPRGVLTHACHTSRALSYYARPLLALGPYCSRPLRAVLRGVTHGPADAAVDALPGVAVPLLRRLTRGADTEPRVEVRRRALDETGEITLSFGGVVRLKLPPVDLTNPGVVKRIRGTAFATRTSPAALARMVDATRAVLNRFTPDVYIHTDHSRGSKDSETKAGGYGIQLVAETTEGCLLGADWSTEDPNVTPEKVAQTALNLLCEEIASGACVDSEHSPMALLYCALADCDVARVRVGKLSDAGVAMLRDLKQFYGVVFRIRVAEGAPEYEDSPSESDGESDDDNDNEDEEDGNEQAKKTKTNVERGIVLSCVGIGQSNMARQRF